MWREVQVQGKKAKARGGMGARLSQPKHMSKEEEEAYVGGHVVKERHAVSGLGGSQKAEVAWLDKHHIPYMEVDVLDFIDEVPTVALKAKPSMKNGKAGTQVYPIHEEDGDETTEVASLVGLTAEEVTYGENLNAPTTSLEEVATEESTVTHHGHAYEHTIATNDQNL
jgi:hypothetical protein